MSVGVIENTKNNLDNPIVPYAGADTRGIIISNCKNIKLNNNIIKLLESTNGCCEGVCLNEINQYVTINDLNVYNMKSQFISPLVLSHKVKDYELNNIKVKSY
jgi:hypothetical protein